MRFAAFFNALVYFFIFYSSDILSESRMLLASVNSPMISLTECKVIQQREKALESSAFSLC